MKMAAALAQLGKCYEHTSPAYCLVPQLWPWCQLGCFGAELCVMVCAIAQIRRHPPDAWRAKM